METISAPVCRSDSVDFIRVCLKSVPKWKLALILGAPVALAYCLYYRQKHSKRVDDNVVPETKAANPASATNAAREENAGNATDAKNESKSPKTAAFFSFAEAPRTRSLSAAVSSKDAGNQLLKSGKIDEAIAAYTRAIDECPVVDGDAADAAAVRCELAKMFQNRAFAREKLGDVAATLADCDEAIRLYPSYERAWSRRSKAREVGGDLLGSLDDATTLCILEEFKKEESLLTVDRILKAYGAKEAAIRYPTREIVAPSPQSVRTYFAAFARDPVFPQDESRASRFEVPATSTFSPFLKARGAVLEYRDLDTVVDLCQREIETASVFCREALLLKASFLMLRGSGDEALRDLNTLLSSPVRVDDPSDVDIRVNAHIKRGSLRMSSKDVETAFADFTSAEQLDSSNSDVYHHRGQLNLLVDRISDACRDFTRCVDLAPDFALARVQHSFTQYRFLQSEVKRGGGRVDLTDESKKTFEELLVLMDESRKMFEELLERFPDCAEGWALFGQVMLDEKQFAKADQLFQKALEIEPDNGNVYVHRGLCRLQSDCDGLDSETVENRPVSETCRRFLEKALEVDPRCEFAYETLGTVEVQAGRLEKASALFQNAIAIAKTEMEMAHLISLNAAAVAQIVASRRLGVGLADD